MTELKPIVPAPIAQAGASNEDWDRVFPDLNLVHEMHFTLKDEIALSDFARDLSSARAHMQALALTRQGDGLAIRCRVGGISPEAARTFIAGLAQTGLVSAAASVEHIVLGRARTRLDTR